MTLFSRTRPRASRAQTSAELLLIVVGSFVFILLVTGVLRATVLSPTRLQVNSTNTEAGGFNKILPTGNQACSVSVSPAYFSSAGGTVTITVKYSNLAPASQQVTVSIAGTPLVLSNCASASGAYEQSCSNTYALPVNAGSNPVNYPVSATIGTTVCTPATAVVAPPQTCAQTDASCGPTGACTDCTASYQCFNSTHRTNTGTCVTQACAYAGAVACTTGFTCSGNACVQPTGSPTVQLNSPANGASAASNSYQAFTFTPQDDYGFSNASIWTNFTGSWARTALNASQLYNNTQYSISALVPDGKTSYSWTAQVCDDNTPSDVCVFNDTNRTLTVDLKNAWVNVSGETGVQYKPDVAYNTVNDEFLVLYESNQSHATASGGNFELYAARHSSASGAQLATPTALTSGGTHLWGFAVRVAYVNTSNVALALFGSNVTNGLSVLTVHGADASLATGETAVGTSGSVNFGTFAAGNPDRDEFAVFWSDDSAGGVSHGYFKIFRASDLATVVGVTQVATGNATSGVNPKGLAYDNVTREYAFLWQQPMGGSSPAFSLRRVSATGSIVGSQVNVQTDVSESSHNYALAYDYKRDEYAVGVLNGTGPSLVRVYGSNASPGGIPAVDLGLGGSYLVGELSYNPWGNEYLYTSGNIAKRVTDTGTVPSQNVTVFASSLYAPVLHPAHSAFATSATASNRNHFVVTDSGYGVTSTCWSATNNYCANAIGQLVYG